MRSSIFRARFLLILFVLAAAAAPAQAQTPTRRLSVDEAVRLALEQNLGIQIERLNPQIQDIAVAQARSFWVPTVSSTLSNNSTTSPSTSALSGGQTSITDSRFSTELADLID